MPSYHNQGTMSDWIIALEQAGSRELAESFRSRKLEDYQRLKESGLPTFADLILPYAQFKADNPELLHFFSQYNPIVIRAIPNVQTLPRRYKKGVSSFEESRSFLESVIEKGKENLYSVFLTEYEPQKYSGVIISTGDEAVIEISTAGLDDLSHGKVIPAGGGFSSPNSSNFRRMSYYNCGSQQEKELIWRLLQFIRKDLPADSGQFSHIHFLPGYFELTVTENGRIAFWDYKVKEGYLR